MKCIGYTAGDIEEIAVTSATHTASHDEMAAQNVTQIALARGS